MAAQGAQVSPAIRIVPYVIVISLCIGLCVLEFFLARRKKSFPGLVIPLAFAAVSIIIVIANLTWSSAPWQTGVDSIVFFLVCNIPTLVTLIIYLICRSTRRRKRQLEIMQAQDLE